MRSGFFAKAGVMLALALASPAWADEAPVFSSELHKFRVVTVVEGLQHPWSIAFLPGGDLLVTERTGTLRVVRNGQLDPAPVTGVPKVRFAGQGGLLEVALHPQFASNRLVYLSFAKPNADGTQGTTAVVRARFDGKALTNVREIFEAKAWSTGGAHYSGKMLFDGKGHLFVTVGDRGADPLGVPREQHPAQNLMLHQGKVIRLMEDGSVPRDNPFVGRADALPEIWSYGHRNLQGIVMNQETGELFTTEHGPQGGDELNRIQPGKNYGWPVIGYGVQYGGRPIHEARAKDGYEQPLQFWVPAIGASGLMIYTGDKFARWRGHTFAGALSGRYIARMNVAATADGYQISNIERTPLLAGYARIREVRQGPDGFIYLATDDRTTNTPQRILRLEPAD